VSSQHKVPLITSRRVKNPITSQNWSNWVRFLSWRWKFFKKSWCVARLSPTRSAPFHLLLGHFPASKLSLGWLVGKVWMSTFQPKYNFPIWCLDAPPKVHSPKTASCVSKKGQWGHFLHVFWPFGDPNLDEMPWKFLSRCISSWQT